VGLEEERSLQKKGGYTNRIAPSHLYAGVRIKKREGKLRGTTRALRTQVAMYTDADVWFLRPLFRTVTNFTLLANEYVSSTLY
jgi:hypothetical protein